MILSTLFTGLRPRVVPPSIGSTISSTAAPAWPRVLRLRANFSCACSWSSYGMVEARETARDDGAVLIAIGVGLLPLFGGGSAFAFAVVPVRFGLRVRGFSGGSDALASAMTFSIAAAGGGGGKGAAGAYGLRVRLFLSLDTVIGGGGGGCGGGCGGGPDEDDDDALSSGRLSCAFMYSTN